MTDDRLDVYIRAELAGRLEWDRTIQRGTFIYDQAYRSGTDPTPLSLSIPLAATRHRGEAVAAYLWGLLPDNEAVLDRWGRRFQVSVSNPMGLLANIGTDLPGAVSMVQPDADLESGGAIEWLTAADVEARLAEVRRDHTAWLGPDDRWSLGGAQEKIALLELDDRWAVPSGAYATNRILKPALSGLDDHDLNEHLCLASARRLGLRAARTRIITFGSERAVVVDRFDRRPADDTTQTRFHQEDLCQALGVRPAAKYQSDGGPSATDIVELLRAQVDDRDRDIDAFIDALIFNWLIAAPDAHAKNYSVLLSGDAVRLAPLYDLASALPYDDVHGPKVKLAMKVGGYYRVSAIGTTAWRRLADDAALDPDTVIERARVLAEQVPSAIDQVASELPDPTEPMAVRLVERVAERAAACRSALS